MLHYPISQAPKEKDLVFTVAHVLNHGGISPALWTFDLGLYTRDIKKKKMAEDTKDQHPELRALNRVSFTTIAFLH